MTKRSATPLVTRWRIGQLVEGAFGRIVGTVEAEGPLLRSPLTDRLCVYYELTLPEGRVKHRRRAVPFRVADESGSAIVDASIADVAIVDETESMLDGVGYVERVILPGSRIAVTGVGVHELAPADDDPFRGVLSERLRFERSPSRPLSLCDAPESLQ